MSAQSAAERNGLLWPREAGEFIASRSKEVKVREEGVQRVADLVAKALKEGRLNLTDFNQDKMTPVNKGLTEVELADWVFMIDSLNFNFWMPDGAPKYSIVYEGKKRSGYIAMVAAVRRAIDEGKRMYDPRFYSKLTLDDIKHIFRSDTASPIPLLNERVQVLRQVGSKLIEKYDGTFHNVLKEVDGSAEKLIELVSSEFPCFKDVSVYDGQEVALFKRVQILASDVMLLYQGKGLGAFTDIDTLTMFADYRVPQVLAYFGTLEYSDSLKDKLEKEYLFNSGDQEEVEIRGCSIHAVELIVAETRKILASRKMPADGLNSAKVDNFLWDFRVLNAHKLASVPYHRVRCIYY